MMNNGIIKILFFCFLSLLLYSSATAQELNKVLSNARDDTLNPAMDKGILFYRYNYDLSKKLDIQEHPAILSSDGNIWLQTFSRLRQFDDDNNIDATTAKFMLAPLRLQYIDSQKLSALHYILSVAEASAVGIMAYQHIKKYGLK